MICSRCGDNVYLFNKTQKGKIYCWKCWSEIMQWLNSKNKLQGCYFCGEEKVFWEDNVFIGFRKLQLCEDCYQVYMERKILMEVKNGTRIKESNSN